MRTATLSAAAAFAALAAAPASAVEVFNVGAFGTLTGSTYTIVCVSGSPPGCSGGGPGGQRVDPFVSSFSFSLYTSPLAEGDNPFSYGFEFGAGFYTGIINNSGGTLTGRDLIFTRVDGGSCRQFLIGCQSVSATATTFNVTGGVPEPSTWAMMLMGFGAVGYSLRRRRKLGAMAQPA